MAREPKARIELTAYELSLTVPALNAEIARIYREDNPFQNKDAARRMSALQSVVLELQSCRLRLIRRSNLVE